MLGFRKRARRHRRRFHWALATALWRADVIDEATAKRLARELDREGHKAVRREDLARG